MVQNPRIVSVKQNRNYDIKISIKIRGENMIKEKSCGCIIFNDEKKVLLVHMNHGHWSFPKGHVENDESKYLDYIKFRVTTELKQV